MFGAEPTCAWGRQANLASATNYQDMWWNPAESGWGMNFTHQGDMIFATWFTYDGDGKPLWLVVAGRGPRGSIGDGEHGKGPAFDAEPFDPGKVVGTPVGDATFRFADGNNGRFAYTVNGTGQRRR